MLYWKAQSLVELQHIWRRDVKETAALISGLLESFDPSKYSVTRYIQRFELFVKANDIPEERKKSVLLTAIGYDSYEVLANIFEKPDQETLETRS